MSSVALNFVCMGGLHFSSLHLNAFQNMEWEAYRGQGSYFTNRGQRLGFGLEFTLYLHGPWWFCSQISIYSHQSTYKMFCAYQTLYYTAIYLSWMFCFLNWANFFPINESAGWQVNSCTWLPVYWTYFLLCNHHKRQQPFMARKTNYTEDTRQGRIMWWSLMIS